MMDDTPIDPQKIESISKNLEALKASRGSEKTTLAKPSSAASKAAVDFFSATAVCSLLGYGVDYLLNSSPWGLIIGLLAGTGVGAKLMMNAMSKDA
jgi:F0F1-type ATP synthase assembly protein I